MSENGMEAKEMVAAMLEKIVSEAVSRTEAMERSKRWLDRYYEEKSKGGKLEVEIELNEKQLEALKVRVRGLEIELAESNKRREANLTSSIKRKIDLRKERKKYRELRSYLRKWIKEGAPVLKEFDKERRAKPAEPTNIPKEKT
jgi:hypothetical protein